MSESQHRRRVHLVALVLIAVAACAALGVALATEINQMGIIFNPQGNQPPEELKLLSYKIDYDQNQVNPTLLTLSLENDGVAYSELSTLTIRDLSSSSFTTTQNLNQTIGPAGSTANVTVDTIGSGFYFIHGHSYAFTVNTTRGGQFAFQGSYS